MQLFICTEGSHLNGTFKQEVNIITSDSIEGGWWLYLSGSTEWCICQIHIQLYLLITVTPKRPIKKLIT